MRIPILMYHQVSAEASSSFGHYIVAPRALATQMRWLKRTGYTSITLDAFLAGRRAPQTLPQRPIVITFDDGYRDSVRYATEVLQQVGFTATFFIVAGTVGQTSRWLMRERGLELPMAGWAELRELDRAGFRCGAHSVTHPRLASLSDAACHEELSRSRAILEDALGREVVHFAYPFGSFNARVRELTGEAGFQTACTVQVGVAAPADDPLTLRRVFVRGGDTLPDFVWRIRTGRSVREELRRIVRGCRTRLMG